MSTSWVQQRSGDALPQGAIKGGQEADQTAFQIARAVLSDGCVLFALPLLKRSPGRKESTAFSLLLRRNSWKEPF